MAEYRLVDLPRELTEDETHYLDRLVSDVVNRWEFEAAQPSHVCTKVHGGAIVDSGDGPRHEHEPRCHDCGRELHRPPGTDDQTWLCPNARRILQPSGPDSSVECGETR